MGSISPTLNTLITVLNTLNILLKISMYVRSCVHTANYVMLGTGSNCSICVTYFDGGLGSKFGID